MATGDKHYGIWWTDPNGSTFDYGGTLGGYSEFNTFLINWDGVTNPPEVECNNGYNAVWLYDNEEDTTGVTTHNNTTYYGWGTTISSGANKIYRIVTTANYTDVDIAFKSDGTIQVFNSDYERVGDDFYINIGVVPKYLSKLSNGTNTYVLKDSEARTSISTIQNNLVTSVSSASTDSQYPSAKCVYDISQQIESLLHDLNSGEVVILTASKGTFSGMNGTAYVEYNGVETALSSTASTFTFKKDSTVNFGIKDFGDYSGSWTYTVNGTSTTLSFNKTSNPQTASITISADTTLSISAVFSGCCIPYYTEILYADNTTKQADQVQVGDKLIGYNEKTQEFVETTVLSVTEVMRNDILRITTESGNTLDLTPDHPVLTNIGWSSYDPEATNRTYSDIVIPLENNLKVGMKLLNQNGEYEAITDLSAITISDKAIRTYTYNVTDGIDTYVTNGFISHNHF